MQNTLLKNFLLEHFDFDELKRESIFDNTIKREDYQKQADRICQLFGFTSVYQYKWETFYAHISISKGLITKDEDFTTEFKAWHED